jgi:release factor glutamine methyltransferase
MRLSGDTTRAAALAAARLRLREAPLEEAALDARILLEEACNIDATALALAPEHPIGDAAARLLEEWIERRLAREPVWRILGLREFWGLPFRLTPATLVPRPDTEALVELSLRCLEGVQAPRILDLGTGSGCILVALLHERPDAWGVGVDRSQEAVATARANARANGVGDRCAFLVGDWCAAIRGAFDLVVSNPPYIGQGELARLEPEVREHDPVAALDGGGDGLGPYPTIFAQSRNLLSRCGRVGVEYGIGQGDDVARIAAASGFACVERVRDLGGVERAAAFELPKIARL